MGSTLLSASETAKWYDTEIHFCPEGRTLAKPFVKEIYDFTLTDTTGVLTFDGYYYIENHPPPYPEDEALHYADRPQRWSYSLPQTLEMHVLEYTDKRHREFKSTFYTIRCTKKVIHECTNVYGKETDEDGEEMNICFFSTDKQTIYFEILEKNEPTMGV
jgi:hypothetical protein